jgi:hypothetical protein
VVEGAEVGEIVHLADRGSPLAMNVACVERWATGLGSADPSPRRSRLI